MEPLIPKPISIMAQGMLSLRANARLGVAGFDFCGDWLFFLAMDARSVEGKQHGNHGASICNNRMLRMVERAQSRPLFGEIRSLGGGIGLAGAGATQSAGLLDRALTSADRDSSCCLVRRRRMAPAEFGADAFFKVFFWGGGRGEETSSMAFPERGAKVRLFSHLASIMRLGCGFSGRFFRLVFQPADLSAALPRCRGVG